MNPSRVSQCQVGNQLTYVQVLTSAIYPAYLIFAFCFFTASSRLQRTFHNSLQIHHLPELARSQWASAISGE